MVLLGKKRTEYTVFSFDFLKRLFMCKINGGTKARVLIFTDHKYLRVHNNTYS